MSIGHPHKLFEVLLKYFNLSVLEEKQLAMGLKLWHKHLSCCLRYSHPTWEHWFKCIQCRCTWKATEDSPNIWAFSTNMGDPGGSLGSWPWPGPTPITMAIWNMNYWMGDFPLSLSLSPFKWINNLLKKKKKVQSWPAVCQIFQSYFPPDIKWFPHSKEKEENAFQTGVGCFLNPVLACASNKSSLLGLSWGPLSLRKCHCCCHLKEAQPRGVQLGQQLSHPDAGIDFTCVLWALPAHEPLTKAASRYCW